MRLDPTIQYDDILMRMYRAARPASFNPLNMRRLRARNNLDLILWERRPMKGNNNARTQEILARLPAHQVAANTTTASLPVTAGPSTIHPLAMASQINIQFPTLIPAPPFTLQPLAPIVRISTTHQAHARIRRDPCSQSDSTSTLYSSMENNVQLGSMDQIPTLPQPSSRRSARVSRVLSTHTTLQDLSSQPGTSLPAARRRTTRLRGSRAPALSQGAISADDALDSIEFPQANSATPTSAFQAADNISAATEQASDHNISRLSRSAHPLDLWPLTYGRTIADQMDQADDSTS